MTQNFYDLTNPIRDVSPVFDTLISQRPSFLRALGSVGTSIGSNGQPLVKNPKYEWINETISPYSSAIASFDTDGDGTGINLASTAGIVAGSILAFESTLGASKTEQVQVVSVDSATDLTVTRDYGGTTGVTLVVGDVAILISSPQNDASAVGAATLQQGSAAYNYTEIFDESYALSATAMATQTYDQANILQNQAKAAYNRLAYKLERALIMGVAVQRTSSVRGTLGGVLSLISASGGNIDATGGAVSKTLINNVVESIISDGGLLTQPLILCAPTQARKLSALNTSASNPIIYKDNADSTLGNFVSSFVGDLPINGQGTVAPIFTTFHMPKDKIAILDMSLISMRVMRGLQELEATTPGTDAIQRRLITELTLEVRNATKAHGIITGLNL